MANRKILQLSGSSFSAIQALSGDDVLKGRELLVSTDTKELVLGNGDGTGTVIGAVIIGDATAYAATSPVKGRLFFNTTTGSLYVANGTAWTIASAVPDLSPFISKVTGATAGHLASLNADGTLQDSGLALNDSGSTATDIWSAQKTIDAITDAVNGLSWQRPVKDVLLTPPASPTAGDRYLVVGGTATGAWVGKENAIAEYTSESTWEFYTPVDGAAVFAQDADEQYAFNGTEWVNINSAFTYSAGNGVTITNKVIAAKVKDLSGITVDANGLAANVDGTSIAFNASTGAMYVKDLDFGTF